jgi:hypothetical protein
MSGNGDQMAVLFCLGEITEPDGEYCAHFAALSRETFLPVKRVRFLCRLLKRKGLAEFHQGLWTEDGEPAGAGYCISRSGKEFIASAEVDA